MTLAQGLGYVLVMVGLMSCSYPVQALKPQDVIAVQNVDLYSVYRRLATAGFDPGPYNDTDLSQLSQAIKRFQAVARLETHGVLNADTWQALQKLYDPQASVVATVNAPKPSGHASKQVGPSSAWLQLNLPASVIQTIQNMLIHLGYDNIKESGEVDMATQLAVRQFQQASNLPVDGQLTTKTLSTLFAIYCKTGCNIQLSGQLKSAHTSPEASPTTPLALKVEASNWQALYIKTIQQLLTNQGYSTQGADGILGPSTRAAIRNFQHDQGIPEDGQLTEPTMRRLFQTSCQSGCTLDVSVRPQTTVVKIPTQQLQPMPPPQIPLDTPVHVNDAAYAIEKIECSDVSGAWVLFLQGTVIGQDDQRVALRLLERFGYRYDPKSEGIYREDWWCVPKRRHCYSTVAFNDWGGTYSRGQEQSFPRNDVYNAQIGIINGISQLLQKRCKK